MYDPEQDMAAAAQSSNLNEELGQVQYVFSDKTGTLTCNVMQFSKFTAGLKSYGTGKKPKSPQESNVCFDDPEMLSILRDTSHPHNESLEKVVLLLSLCHTMIIDQEKGIFNAASPDELALGYAAKQFGYVFTGYDADDNMTIENRHTSAVTKYKLLSVCDFTSTRKRMSVILRDP